MKRPAFRKCIAMLRSSDAMTYEDGFHWLVDQEEFTDDLIEMMIEESDPEFRGKLIELIGSSKNPKTIPILAAELSSEHSKVREWAYYSLCYSESRSARVIAEQFKTENPYEDYL